METIKILSWFVTDYLKRVLGEIEKKRNIKCRDIADFGVRGSYYNNIKQEDFDRIITEYKPDIIILVDRTKRNLSVDIADNIKVITFCDHSHEQFCTFGKIFFDKLPKNNYLYHLILDAKNIDKDEVLSNVDLQKRIFFTPFLPCVAEADDMEDCEKYVCDISVMLKYRKIDYYYGCECVKFNNPMGRMLMNFLSEIIVSVRNNIEQNETAYMDDECIQKLVLAAAERIHVKQYVRDYNQFLEYWTSEVKYLVIPSEFGNCIVDWLSGKDYNLKIYGAGWKDNKKYERYSFGKVPDGSSELRKAYQCSKINIGTNIGMGIHRRTFEAMESDCLYMQAEAHRSWFFSDWRNYFEDGKDIVIFHDKKELFQKIDYLLSHENERKRITQAAKKKMKSCPDITDVLGDAIMEVYRK